MQTTNKTGYKAIIVTIGVLLTGCIFYFGYAIGHYETKTILECPYEFGECPNKGCSQNIGREYQFNTSDEGTDVFQGNRYVGFLPLDTTQGLYKLISFDNSMDTCVIYYHWYTEDNKKEMQEKARKWDIKHKHTHSYYQFDLEESGTTVYQGNRRVGFLPFDSTQTLDILMIQDNL